MHDSVITRTIDERCLIHALSQSTSSAILNSSIHLLILHIDCIIWAWGRLVEYQEMSSC